MAMQSRLYRLKSWLTLEDAASHLSTLLSEKVGVSDLLQLALEGQLIISVNLIGGVKVKKGEITGWLGTPVTLAPKGSGNLLSLAKEAPPPDTVADDARKISGKTLKEALEYSERLSEGIKKGDFVVCPLGDAVSDDEFVSFKGEVMNVEGIWDLPLISAERIDVEEMYQESVGGPEVDLISLNGPWLKAEEGFLYCIQERFSKQHIKEVYGEEGLHYSEYNNPNHYYPAGRLPDNCSIVVRRCNLDAFIASLEGPEQSTGQPAEGEVIRALEAFGLLVELYASQHGPDYRHGERPKASRIVEDMLAAVPDDVTNMGDRKLKDHVGAAIKAWEAKKRL
ncbi:hypothetical protein [Halomonas cerina]|uniref:Uncharacterized protein n=1 Tax=Halomonas cerina TaxID=447424 RepID=A0A839V695_9GAMM|nr:hypothetical protein [Halomonas cerina]MBB3190661.1 hypothetical protein [Halomonas cerina]